MRRALVGLAAAAAAVALAGPLMLSSGGSIDVFVGSTPTPVSTPSNTAHLWIDSNGGSCTFNSSPVPYSGTGDSTSCASTSAAYTAADSASASASTVAIRAGSYTDQTIPESTRTGGVITFVETNGDVTLNTLDIHGDKTAWVGETTSKNLSFAGSTTRAKVASFTGFTAMGGGFNCPSGCDTAVYISDAEDFTFSNGEICCGTSRSCLQCTREAVRTNVPSGTAITPDRITIENSNIHDWNREAGVHTECALLLSVQTLTVRNNHFWNCSVYSISLGRLGGTTDPDPTNNLIESNTFEPSDDTTPGDQAGASNVVLDHVNTRYNGLTFRSNSFSQNIEINTADVPDATGYDQTFMYSNILPTHTSLSCVPAGMTSPTYAYNVLPTGSTCGANRTNVATPVNLYASHTTGGTWNFHLASGSAAIGAGSPTAGQFSTTDIGGFPRDGAPDAGAYEFGSGS